MGILIGSVIGFLAGALLSYFYHDAAIADLRHLKSAAEAERDLVKRQYNELIEKLHAK